MKTNMWTIRKWSTIINTTNKIFDYGILHVDIENPHGTYISYFHSETYCFYCKEPIPEHIKIQAKLLDPVKWSYL